MALFSRDEGQLKLIYVFGRVIIRLNYRPY